MDTPTTFTAILAAGLRHAITLAGGFMVAKGAITADQGPEFVGIGMALSAFAWSWLQKHNASKTLQAALGGFSR